MSAGFRIDKPEGERQHGTHRHRWEDDIKTDLKETSWKGVERFSLS
jgi:hypothetical protein